ncbi:MAG: hypothetical protein IPL40_16585 [Proteobacteria bacterium]|nr:hypothetical protein [Pseudomonadota bacterium]
MRSRRGRSGAGRARTAAGAALALCLACCPAALARAAAAATTGVRAVAPLRGYALRLAGTHAELRAGDGEPLLDLAPELEVVTAAGRRRRQRWVLERRGATVGGHSTSWVLAGELVVAAAHYLLRLEGDEQGRVIDVELTVRQAAPAALLREALRFVALAPRGVVALDRGYRSVANPLQPFFVDALTPHRLRFWGEGGAAVTLSATAGLQGYWLRPRPRGGYELELELDDARNRPLARYRGCSEAHPSPSRRSRPMGSQSGLALRDPVLRLAGSQRRYRWQWLIGEASLPEVRRFPSGYQSALVLTDHADQSSAERLEALAFGATGAVGAGRIGPQWPGLVNRGLSYSKTVFARRVPPYAVQLDDERYRALLARVAAQGVELGLHSLSGGPDDPGDPRTVAAFAAFRALSGGRLWIDHRPTTNCEAISNRGADPTSRWFILPLLRRFGLRYLWRGADAQRARRRAGIDLLRSERPGERPAVLYRGEQLVVAGQRPFLLFGSSWLFFTHWRQLLAALSPRALDRLAANHGLAVGHVYLETCRARGRLHGRELLRALGGERYVLRPAVDRLFVALARRQREGSLWVTGLEALADHLLGAMRVTLEPVAQDGSVRLRYTRDDGPAVLRAVTLRWPPGVVDVIPSAGVVLGGRRVREGRLETWCDLSAGLPITLRPLLREGSREASRRRGAAAAAF